MLPVDLVCTAIRPIQFRMLDKKNIISCYKKDMQPKLDATTAHNIMIDKEEKENSVVHTNIDEKAKNIKVTAGAGKGDKQRMWTHRIDLKKFKPEEIKVDNSKDERSVFVHAAKLTSQEDKTGVEVKRTVFIPDRVDVFQISSYVDNSGYLIIQAPFTSKSDSSSCNKCNLKRKHDSIEMSNKLPNVREDFQKRTENSFEDDESDANPTKKCKLTSDVIKLETKEEEPLQKKPLTFSVESLLGKEVVSSKAEESENKNNREEVESKMDTTNDSEMIAIKKKDENGSEMSDNESGKQDDSTKSSEDTSVQNHGINDLGYTTVESGSTVLLCIPMKSFFPEEDKVNISLKDNILSFRAVRKMQVGGGSELSEMFLKEFTFPSHFDCRTMRLSRDKKGNVIICVSKKSTSGQS